MPSLSFTITGDKQVVSRLERLKPDIDRNTQQALTNAANNVATVAKQNAPYLTGYLRSQIQVESATPLSVNIVAGAEYSIYQEARVGFMATAFSSAQAVLLREIQTAVSRATSGGGK